MSKESQKCDIVLDLIPLYLDGKTTEVSNLYINEHLKECKECRQVFGFMSAELPKMCDQSKKSFQSDSKHQGFIRKFRHFCYKNKGKLILIAGILGYLFIWIQIISSVFQSLTGTISM